MEELVQKDFKERALRRVKEGLGRLCRRRSVTITEYDPSFKVLYLGNVLTGWAKGDGCVEKPLSTLWKSYQGSCKPDVQMKMTVTQSGLKAVTKEHGLTEYWSHRVTYCAAPSDYPKVFCWVYRHEGRKLKQELRCHAVLCAKEAHAKRMAQDLSFRLAQALIEFKRDKLSKQKARLSLANAVYDNPSLPRRKILLSTGSQNYRPPLERSKSAPKLMSIEESVEEEEEETETRRSFRRFRPFQRTLTEVDEIDPFKNGVHVEGEFDSHLLEEVVEDPGVNDRVNRMSWAGEELLESGFLEPETLEAAFAKLYPQAKTQDMLEDYLEDESTPSLQSISSGSDRPHKTPYDLDSLSEEDSDESGFVEVSADDKIRDLPHHQLVKPCLHTSKSTSLEV
ncbi:protein FAM43A [Cimex lectularius]|uniref:PID domain-containing protein n=1 Tax=Cimex lectularius TaxID=79782 RepID=A0A8I6RM70_CIMLE|nr:protein FAM43A [Cimex lectularius]